MALDLSILTSNPFPLGYIHPAPGTKADFFANYPSFRTEDFYSNFWVIQAGPDNLGRVYIGNESMNSLTGEGVILVLLGGGDTVTFSSVAGNVYRLNTFRIEVESAGDGALVSVYIR